MHRNVPNNSGYNSPYSSSSSSSRPPAVASSYGRPPPSPSPSSSSPVSRVVYNTQLSIPKAQLPNGIGRTPPSPKPNRFSSDGYNGNAPSQPPPPLPPSQPPPPPSNRSSRFNNLDLYAANRSSFDDDQPERRDGYYDRRQSATPSPRISGNGDGKFNTVSYRSSGGRSDGRDPRYSPATPRLSRASEEIEIGGKYGTVSYSNPRNKDSNSRPPLPTGRYFGSQSRLDSMQDMDYERDTSPRLSKAKYGTVGPAYISSNSPSPSSNRRSGGGAGGGNYFGTVGPSSNLSRSFEQQQQPYLIRGGPGSSPRRANNPQPLHFNTVADRPGSGSRSSLNGGGLRKTSLQVNLRPKLVNREEEPDYIGEDRSNLNRTSSVGQLVEGYETIGSGRHKNRRRAPTEYYYSSGGGELDARGYNGGGGSGGGFRGYTQVGTLGGGRTSPSSSSGAVSGAQSVATSPSSSSPFRSRPQLCETVCCSPEIGCFGRSAGIDGDGCWLLIVLVTFLFPLLSISGNNLRLLGFLFVRLIIFGGFLLSPS